MKHNFEWFYSDVVEYTTGPVPYFGARWKILQGGSAFKPLGRYGHGATVIPYKGTHLLLIFGGIGLGMVPKGDMWIFSRKNRIWNEEVLLPPKHPFSFHFLSHSRFSSVASFHKIFLLQDITIVLPC